jgi:hypothetical protein
VTTTKALTLHHPHAAFVPAGRKPVETRSAPPAGELRAKGVRPLPGHRLRVGERLAVCSAAYTTAQHGMGQTGDLWWSTDRVGCLLRSPDGIGDVVGEYPFGSLLAFATFAGAVRTEELAWVDGRVPDGWRRQLVMEEDDHETVLVSADVRPFGDFGPGRWAWLLEDVEATEPRPVTGSRGVWVLEL